MDMKNRLYTYVGDFAPKRTDDLRSNLTALIGIGRPLFFKYLWTNDDDETNYPGEACYELVMSREELDALGIKTTGWIPACDIRWAARPRLLTDEELEFLLESE